MKKPSEYSTEELNLLKKRITSPCGELETFARLGVIFQQWLNRYADLVAVEMPPTDCGDDNEDAEEVVDELTEVINKARSAFSELRAVA